MCVCMNDHVLCFVFCCFFFTFFIHKFPDGKEGGGETMLAMKNLAIALSLFCVVILIFFSCGLL